MSQNLIHFYDVVFTTRLGISNTKQDFCILKIYKKKNKRKNTRTHTSTHIRSIFFTKKCLEKKGNEFNSLLITNCLSNALRRISSSPFLILGFLSKVKRLPIHLLMSISRELVLYVLEKPFPFSRTFSLVETLL